jgi:hypothetical protein
MTNLLTQNAESHGLARWLGVACLIGSAAVVAWIVASVLVNGPQARAMAEQQDAREIAQENRSFCAKVGLAPNTQPLDTCLNEVAQIRRLHEERLYRDANFL